MKRKSELSLMVRDGSRRPAQCSIYEYPGRDGESASWIYFVAGLDKVGQYAVAGSDHAIRACENGEWSMIYQHADKITSLKSSRQSWLASSSLDGTCVLSSTLADPALPHQILKGKGKAGYLWLDCNCDGSIIAASTELCHDEARIDIFERRTGNVLLSYTESHSDDITQVSFHPTRERILLSAGVDGLLVIYDTSIADEDDAVLSVMNTGSSVHRAGFLDPPDRIFALSHMETLSLWSFDNGDRLYDYGDLRTVLAADGVWHTDYIIDLLPSPEPGLAFYIYAGNHSGQVACIAATDTDPFQLDTLIASETPRPDLVRSVARLNGSPSASTTVCLTGGEKGLLSVWNV